jgi:hypothetical protein
VADKPLGRPREVVDPVRVNVQIPAPTYDRLYRQARQQDVSVPALIRRAIAVLESSQGGGSPSR